MLWSFLMVAKHDHNVSNPVSHAFAKKPDLLFSVVAVFLSVL